MSDYVYMKVTRDKYELPLAVANSATELARICGLKPRSVYNCMSRARTGRRHSTKYADDDGVCQNSIGLVIQDDDDFCSRAERRQDAIN